MFTALGLCIQKRADLLVSLMQTTSQDSLVRDSVQALRVKLGIVIGAIPIVGLITCGVALLTILAAHRSIDSVQAFSQKYAPRFEEFGLPAVIGGGLTDLPTYGSSLSFLLPALAALIWLGTLVLIAT